MSNTQLAIDTSSRLTSLYIARETELLGSLGVLMHERRSERLWTQIDFVLGEAGLRIEDVELFSVCTGPGGFTGKRDDSNLRASYRQDRALRLSVRRARFP